MKLSPPIFSDAELRDTRNAINDYYHCGRCQDRSLCIYGTGKEAPCEFDDCSAAAFATGYLARIITTKRNA